jgi:hypothetical protein
VDFLLGYEIALTDLYDWEPLQAAMQQALIPLSAASLILQNLKAQHMSPDHEELRRQADQVLKGYQWLEKAVKYLTAHDYARGRYPPGDRTHKPASELQYQLIYFYYETWRDCGPALNKRIGFTETTVFQLIASVLTHVCIHTGQQRTFTADAIRKALQRTGPLETGSYL